MAGSLLSAESKVIVGMLHGGCPGGTWCDCQHAEGTALAQRTDV